MRIFGEEKEQEDPLYHITRKKDRLFFIHQGWPYDLSPALITQMNMPPNVFGVDYVLNQGAKIKGITGDFGIKMTEEWRLQCDAKMDFSKAMFDGWVYEITGESVKMKKSLVWMCPYLKIVLGSPPATMYLSIVPLL